MKVESSEKVVVAANFTIEPINNSLASFLNRVTVNSELVFAPYNQVFQQLLDPESLFHQNRRGANVIFLRLEDLIDSRNADLAFLEKQTETIRTNASDLAKWLRSAERFSVPLLVFVCPPSARIQAHPELDSNLKAIERMLRESAEDISNLYVFETDHLTSRYRVGMSDNPKANILGHVPYTEEFFSALAAESVRKIDAFRRKPFKVLVLDCDNTLWDGVIGEDGMDGIRISDKRVFLQEFAVAQSESGMVVCLNSKNNEPDVWEVFEKRNDMVLKKEHIVSSRINWSLKSQNLRSIADELQLGLDSFVFIDDDPAVCGEVQRNCPEVFTVLLPETNDFSRFFDHLWAFDRLKITKEDRERTKSYQNQALRRELQANASDLTEFLRTLELVCEISELGDADIPRVSQLTLRTNQFNSTTIRYTEADIRRSASEDKKNIWTVKVRDRFGDYGLVGVVIFGEREESLAIESLMLSCRVLGRGVEYEILRELGNKALASGRESVSIDFAPTAKNAPILNFLEDVGDEYKTCDAGTTTYLIPVKVALDCSPRINPSKEGSDQKVETVESAQVPERTSDTERFQTYVEIANSLSAKSITALEGNLTKLSRDKLRGEFRAARTDTERELTQIWERLLMAKNIGTADNFFEIGGDSMLAVNLFVEIEEKFGQSLPLYHLIDSPTIEKLAQRIEAKAGSSDLQHLVPIRAEGSMPPLFCFHAAGGNVLNYIELANALGDEQPVYGLQMRGVTDKSETAHDRVEDMATAYLKEIRGLQPNGPYRFCGASFGGLVAFEAARQLRHAGESVEILALVDTYAPGYSTNNAVKSGTLKQLTVLFEKFRFNMYYIRQLSTRREQISHVLKRIRGVTLRMKRKARWKQNAIAIQFNKATGKDLPKDMLRNVKAIKRAEAHYRPLPYDGKVVLFRALHQPKHIRFEPLLGWRALIREGLIIEDVEGNHNSAIAYPFVKGFAAKLSRHLAKQEDVAAAAAGSGR